MITKQSANKIRQKKHYRVRNRVTGTPERPRLNVYRSLNNIFAQIIDDTVGFTLVSASTAEPSIKEKLSGKTGNRDAAKEVGKTIAEKAIEKGIKKVVFDRGGYIYHGRVKDLADAAREAGLDF
jgi:large subunit ribosomal protein L18